MRRYDNHTYTHARLWSVTILTHTRQTPSYSQIHLFLLYFLFFFFLEAFQSGLKEDPLDIYNSELLRWQTKVTPQEMAHTLRQV